MDSLSTVLKSLRSNEEKRRQSHLDVFREFLEHLDQAAKQRQRAKPTKKAKHKSR